MTNIYAPYSSFNTGSTQGASVPDGIRWGNYYSAEAGNGVATSPMYVYDIVPEQATANSLVTSTSPGPGTYLTLAGGLGGVTIITKFGLRVARLDVPRVVTISSTGNEAGNEFTVFGYDYMGKSMVETISGVNTNTVSGNKAFAWISYVYMSLGAVGNITVGTGDKFGLPYKCISPNQVIANWNQQPGVNFGTVTLVGGTATILTAAVATDSTVALFRQGPGVGGTLGNLSITTITPATSFVITSDQITDVSIVAWQIIYPQGQLVPADLTDPATEATLDTRGVIIPPTISNGGRRLTVWQYVAGAVPNLQDYNTYYGVNQYTRPLF